MAGVRSACMGSVILCDNLTCERPGWNSRGGRITAFSGRFPAGEVIGFCGEDGCGKGLLLNVIGLLEKADSGRLVLLGHDAASFCEEETATFRNEACGFLFGHPYLLPSFTVAENVAMPLFRICGGEAREARDRTRLVLEFAGIGELETVRAGTLDSALRWRAAFARAIVHEPQILIAISPPAPDLLPLARRAADQFGITVLWAGAHGAVAGLADRVITLENGRAVPA